MLQEKIHEKMLLEAACLKSAMLPTVSPLLHRELGHRPLSLYSDILRTPILQPLPDPFAAAAGPQLRAVASSFNSPIRGDLTTSSRDNNIDSEIMKLLSLKRALATIDTSGLAPPPTMTTSGGLAARDDDWKWKTSKPWPFLG